MDKDNTGKKMTGMRWHQGIHEFIELKHGIVPKKESLTPISLSHTIFYPMYQNIFGLTGTLGSDLEREEICHIYAVNMFDIPTHQPPKRIDHPPLILPSNDALHQTVLDRVRLCQMEHRPLLILCQTIKETEEIQSLLNGRHISSELLNETQEKKEGAILKLAGLPNAITIATNTAGRGTNIKLTEESKAHGGLFVLLTFYPNSLRVEEQARGRAGRQGDPGDSEILISAEQQDLDLTLDYKDLQVQAHLRQQLAELREVHARESKLIHECIAELERHLFGLVQQFFVKMRTAFTVMKSQQFLGDRVNLLKDRKLLSIKPLPLNLASKDATLSRQVLRLMSQETNHVADWLTLMKKVADRIQERLLVDWTTGFYKEVERLSHFSMFTTFAKAQERIFRFQRHLPSVTEKRELTDRHITDLHQFSENYAQALKEKSQEELDSLKRQVDVLFTQILTRSERYLSPTGEGALLYLWEITGLNAY